MYCCTFICVKSVPTVEILYSEYTDTVHCCLWNRYTKLTQLIFNRVYPVTIHLKLTKTLPRGTCYKNRCYYITVAFVLSNANGRKTVNDEFLFSSRVHFQRLRCFGTNNSFCVSQDRVE